MQRPDYRRIDGRYSASQSVGGSIELIKGRLRQRVQHRLEYDPAQAIGLIGVEDIRTMAVGDFVPSRLKKRHRRRPNEPRRLIAGQSRPAGPGSPQFCITTSLLSSPDVISTMQVEGNSGPIQRKPPVELLSTCTVLFGLILICALGSRGRLTNSSRDG
jgi:hypothetical protein